MPTCLFVGIGGRPFSRRQLNFRYVPVVVHRIKSQGFDRLASYGFLAVFYIAFYKR